MNARTKFWGALGLLLLTGLAGLGGVLWMTLETLPAMEDGVIAWLQRVVVMGLLWIFCLGAILVQIWAWMDRVLLKPLTIINRDLAIMATADPAHDITLEPDHLLEDLPRVARQMGDALFHARRQVKESLSNSAEELERLEMVIKHLNVGLVVIKGDGTIVLYNLAVQKLFHNQMDSLGLGRSLYELCARLPVETTMEFLERCNAARGGCAQSDIRFFCAALHDDVMLDCAMSLFPCGQRDQAHFMITFEEATRRMAALRRSDLLMRHALENMRGPVANLRAAAETLLLHG
ncbi:MAG: hypothetical protein HQM02_09580, partial [Magnetococcales bacterium]|nr:hypothetical protein [Magnetococcales bacterium]